MAGEENDGRRICSGSVSCDHSKQISFKRTAILQDF